MSQTHTITSIPELNTLANTLVQSGITTFLLEGELGVGKTQFVKGLVQGLWGKADEVQSPTYTYMNPYATPKGSVVHMDMYRLEEKAHAFSKGIFEAIENHDIVCIERPKREEEYVDSNSVRLQFSFLPDGARKIIITQI